MDELGLLTCSWP